MFAGQNETNSPSSYPSDGERPVLDIVEVSTGEINYDKKPFNIN
jgi:hypothetical protein